MWIIFKFLLRLFIAFVYIYCLLYICQYEEKTHYLSNLKLHIELRLYKYLQSKFEQINEGECPYHQYTIRIIERSPLIIYIEHFLTQHEIEHLVQLAEPLFRPSLIFDENGKHTTDKGRSSTTAFLKRAQTPLVNCLERRFARFQGDIELTHIEPLQVVKYESDQLYEPHYDWFKDWNPASYNNQRVTTFFTYLKANCSMGETEFIDIKFNRTYHERFCDVLLCDHQSEKHGIRFRPIPGNSIFWFNLDELGQPDYMTYHTGRPPGQNGLKMGLNTWTCINDININNKQT